MAVLVAFASNAYTPQAIPARRVGTCTYETLGVRALEPYIATSKASDSADARRGIRGLGRRKRREGTYEPRPPTVPRATVPCCGREAGRLMHGAGELHAPFFPPPRPASASERNQRTFRLEQGHRAILCRGCVRAGAGRRVCGGCQMLERG
jgi:hypothetical protein